MFLCYSQTILFLYFSLADALKLREQKTYDLLKTPVESYPEFLELVKNRYGVLATQELGNTTDAPAGNPLDGGVDRSQRSPAETADMLKGSPEGFKWIYVNHHLGHCYEGTLKNVGWCVGRIACINNIAPADEVELYPSPPGIACYQRGYSKFATQDQQYPDNTWWYVGWKMVYEAKALVKGTPAEAQVNGLNWMAPPPGNETQRKVDYITKCVDLLNSDEYSYTHPECLPANAGATQKAAAEKGAQPRPKWYDPNSMKVGTAR